MYYRAVSNQEYIGECGPLLITINNIDMYEGGPHSWRITFRLRSEAFDGNQICWDIHLGRRYASPEEAMAQAERTVTDIMQRIKVLADRVILGSTLDNEHHSEGQRTFWDRLLEESAPT